MLASFGRGFYILDDYSWIRELSPETSRKNQIFPIKKGLMYRESAPLAVGRRAFQGANFYSAANPPVGVTIRYHLARSLKTAKSNRKSKDRKLAAAGKDVPYPSWKALKAEDREVAPAVWLTIRDKSSRVVRRISGSTSKGIHSVVWNFRHAGYGPAPGPFAVPGAYTVEISQMVDGKITQLVKPVKFEIAPLGFDDKSPGNQQAIITFTEKIQKLGNAVNAANQLANEAQTKLTSFENLARTSTTLEPAILNEIRAVRTELLDVLEAFNGDRTKSRRNESAYPGFQSRLRTAMFGAMGSDEGPTGTHQKQYDIVDAEFSAALKKLKPILDSKIPTLEKKLDVAGAPWTSGRKIPDWK